jgi:hypothetical protein
MAIVILQAIFLLRRLYISGEKTTPNDVTSFKKSGFSFKVAPHIGTAGTQFKSKFLF